jgi:hypothetical protein
MQLVQKEAECLEAENAAKKSEALVAKMELSVRYLVFEREKDRKKVLQGDRLGEISPIRRFFTLGSIFEILNKSPKFWGYCFS